MIPLPTLQRILDRARDINSGRDSELSFDAQDELDIEALAAWEIAMQTDAMPVVRHDFITHKGWAIRPSHEGANAFWEYWRENGATHRHGYYESTWGAINAALNATAPELSGRAT